ncbi:hypothetical protein RhiirC2_775423 [Rhizophagus irregularis]|uniref:Uncharacterized protein n=1 Tax=Rhizophagus irregularis TaxID=588596 RepID=A0A2N1NJ91_9GLOM|nr:hypothetical protein RhiirC2_775423 [Rhizophagus irregularis]
MSLKNYEQKTCGTPPYVQNICFENNACKIIKESKTQKVCSDCKEMRDSVKLISSKTSKTEEVIDDFYKNPIRKSKINQFSIFDAKFILNNVPCELEYDLSNLFRKFT